MPVGTAAADVGIVALAADVALRPAIADAPDMDDAVADALDRVAPAEAAMDELPDAGEDVLAGGVDAAELVEDGTAVCGVCVSRSEIPFTPSTDPVCTLEIGLQGVAFVLGGAGA